MQHHKKNIFIGKTIDREGSGYNFFGFTIFDIIHIVFAITLIIVFAIHKTHADEVGQAQLNQNIAYEIIELVFAAILIAFVDGIADTVKEKEHVGPQTLSTFYLFAWLILDASLLTPEIIEFPESCHESFSAGNLCYFLELGCILVSMIVFIATVFFPKQGKTWSNLMLLAIGFMGLSIPFAVAQDFLHFEGYVSVLEALSRLAPIIPVVYAFISFRNIRRLRKQAEDHPA